MSPTDTYTDTTDVVLACWEADERAIEAALAWMDDTPNEPEQEDRAG